MSEITLSQDAVKALSDTIKRIMALMSEIDNANEDIKEQCEQVKETVDMKPADIKRIAKVLYKDSLEDEREKFEALEDFVEMLKEKI
mgnify:CR=1 FL=1